MINTRKIFLGLAIASTFGLAACSPDHGTSDQQTTATSGQPATVSSSVEQHYQANLTAQGEPVISADGMNIIVTANVTNTGATAFGSTTTPNNVNLGAHSVDASGKVIDQDLARGHLPQIAPGTQAMATILLPVDKVLNKSVALLPVQENVGWFDRWGTKALVVGPFVSCSSDSIGKVCDASGKPLAVAVAKQ